MSEIASVRRMYAQQIVATASATTPALLDAFAAIPRERFLGPGPWLVVGAGDPKPRPTPMTTRATFMRTCRWRSTPSGSCSMVSQASWPA